MVYGFRYIQIDETGLVTSACDCPVIIDDVTITIDTEGMIVPEQPTDSIYELYYNEDEGLHWVKTGEFKPDVDEEVTADELMDILLGVAE